MSDDHTKILVEEGSEVTASDVTTNVSPSEVSPLPAPPDASFETLVSMLFTQGMAALGQVLGSDNQPMPINKSFAKHFIDTIEMLGEKTKGNLSEQESTMLSEVLHAMRMAFVSVKAPK